MTGKAKVAVAALLIAAALAGAGWWWMRSNKEPEGFRFGVSGSDAGAMAEAHKRMVQIGDGPDKRVLHLDSKDPNFEKTLEQLPPELREKVREMMKNGGNMQWDTAGGAKFDKPLLDSEDGKMLSREVGSGVASIEELVKGGMSREDARKVVEKGLADSLQKQLKLPGDNSKVFVTMPPKDGEGRQAVMIGISKDGNPLPAVDGKGAVQTTEPATGDGKKEK